MSVVADWMIVFVVLFSVFVLSAMLEMSRKRVEELEKEVVGLKEEKRVWAKQRAVLMHNLGTVLKTGRGEITRKDRDIGKLLSYVLLVVGATRRTVREM